MLVKLIKRDRTLKYLKNSVRNFNNKHYYQEKSQILNSTLPTTYSTKQDESLKLIFDQPNLWKQTLVNTERTGLLNRLELKENLGFQNWTQQVIRQANHLVEKICNLNTEKDARSIVKRLDRLSDLLCSLIDLAEFVRCLHPNRKLVKEANEAYLIMVNYMNQLNTNPGLYLALKQVLDNKTIVDSFSKEELEVAWLFLKDFEKSGIHLSQEKRFKFVQINDDINELGRDFLENMNPSTTSIQAEKSELNGCEAWWNGTQNVQWIPTSPGYASMLLRTAQNPKLRQRMYSAANTPSKKQTEILDNLLMKRIELAQLLGYESFGEMFLKDKMAGNPSHVEEFLLGLTQRLKPQVESEMDILNRIKMQDPNSVKNEGIMVWDLPFYTQIYEGIQKMKYNYNHLSAISSFFSLGTVIQGLSNLLNELYGIRFEVCYGSSKDELWHDSVRKLKVLNDKNELVGIIYLDLLSRPNKMGNAAHYTVQCSRRLDHDLVEDTLEDLKYSNLPLQFTTVRKGLGSTYQVPVVVLSCCFSSPSNSSPTLLDPSEVETLFHEMGHAIHSMLASTEYHNVAGTRCKIDFVELPSIFMETFALSPSYTSLYAKHYETGKPLPSELLNAYLAKPQLKALDTQHQIMLAMIDQKYHNLHKEDCKEPGFSMTLLPEMVKGLSVVPHVPNTSITFKFGHLVSYSATYYSYLLGRVLANQLFQLGFKNSSNLSRSGELVYHHLLRHGGSKDPWLCVEETLSKLADLNQVKVDGLNELNNSELAMKRVGKWGLPN